MQDVFVRRIIDASTHQQRCFIYHLTCGHNCRSKTPILLDDGTGPVREGDVVTCALCPSEPPLDPEKFSPGPWDPKRWRAE